LNFWIRDIVLFVDLVIISGLDLCVKCASEVTGKSGIQDLNL
jgi:hypothetical protein